MKNTEKYQQIYQITSVVRDLAGTLENWRSMVSFDEQSVVVTEESGLTRAVFDLGGIRMELIEPCDKDGEGIYARALRENGPGFHHIGIYTEKQEDVIREYEVEGYLPFGTDGGYPIYDLSGETGLTLLVTDRMEGPCARKETL